MNPTPYPNLRQIYFDRAEVVRQRWVNNAQYLCLVLVLFGLYWLAAPDHMMGMILITSGALLFAIARIWMLVLGKKNFDRLWIKLLEHVGLESGEHTEYREIEEELVGDTVHFHNVIFTKHYFIAFRKLGDFARVDSIQRLVLEKYSYHSPYNLYNEQERFTLSCDVAGGGRCKLSVEESELRDILYEIRLRNQGVLLDAEAYAYYFPSPVQVE